MGTIKKSELPAIGSPLNGGYYTGLICIAGALSAVIVAPKAYGEHAPINWGESGKSIPATSCNDGAINTAAMAESGSAVAKWAQGLEIAGHKDWYIPSRDELEICYRNLKPTTEENYCSYRDGDNSNSSPIGEIYTDENPAQTPAELFQNGAAEAFDDAWYWSSTQHSAGIAYLQDFSDGDQLYGHKGNDYRVRAVRRDLVIE